MTDAQLLQRPNLRDDLNVEPAESGEGVVLSDPITGRVHTLDAMGAEIARQADLQP